MATVKVTFNAQCPQSIIGVTIQSEDDPSDTEGLLFKESGTKSVQLSPGGHVVSYRAVGTPETAFSLEVTKGGSMPAVNRTLPSDGRAAGDRLLSVT